MPRKRKVATITLDPERWARLAESARERGVSRSQIIDYLIQQWLDGRVDIPEHWLSPDECRTEAERWAEQVWNTL